MKAITVKPVAERLVRHPETGTEIKGPTRVDGDDGFWIRCINAGDVAEMSAEEIAALEEAQRKAEAAAVAAEAAAAKKAKTDSEAK